ncbi:hypothetical protein MUP01_09300 [Candidatus Bathyarchaeota archaeon]|nr:hypothetical protein [Candidatus Bathyarchaeota archaeon]
MNLHSRLRELSTLFALGTLIRFLFSFWTGHPWDFEVFIRVGYYIAHGASLYQSVFYPVAGLGQPIHPFVSGLGYLPIWGLYLALVYKIYSLAPLSPFLYYALIKALPILGDAGSTYILYDLIRSKQTVNEAKKKAIMVFLCPFIIFISSVWGMFDSVAIFFTLLSVWFLLRNRIYSSSFSLGVGIFFKIIPALYLPIQVIFVSRKHDLFKGAMHLLIAFLTPLAFTLLPTGLLGWNISKAFVPVLSQTDKLGDSLTYWNFRPLIKALSTTDISTELDAFFSFPLIRYMWLLGLLVCYVSFLANEYNDPKSLKANDDLKILAKWFFFVTISFLLTRVFIPEQFVIYLLFPMVILVGNHLSTRDFNVLWILTLAFALVNTFPTAFAYLVKPDYWYTFSFYSNTAPFSTWRYLARFIIAALFDLYLARILLRGNKSWEK